MRVFLDANVLIAGLAWKGTCHAAVGLARDHFMVTSAEVVEETMRGIRSKTKLTTGQIRELESWLNGLSQPSVVADLDLPKLSARDSKDVPIVCAAAACHCDVLGTGDRDLLELKEEIEGVTRLRVLSPAEFAAWQGPKEQARSE